MSETAFERSNVQTFERSAVPDLSIIIVNWNTCELLANCLTSIYETIGDLRCEVFVVDNASTDGSAAMVRERYPQVWLIENAENVGFARANNQAIAASRGRYVMLLNPDTKVDVGAPETLVAFMEARPQAGACGPLLRNADGSLQPSCHPLLSPWREFWRLVFLDRLLPRATYPMARWDREQPRRVEVIKGACLLLRREALDQVGPLDGRYFMYTEEMDLCHRIAQVGWQLWWVPAAEVIHYGAASTVQASEHMYLELYRSKVQFQRKFRGDWGARGFKALLALAYLPRWLLAGIGRLFSPALAARERIYRRLLLHLPRL